MDGWMDGWMDNTASIMNIISNIVSSRLWVRGCSAVVFGGSSDWTFYYCLEGMETKSWTLIFYNPGSSQMYIRSPVIDLKVKNVILQTCSYVSNVYKLLLEWTNKTPLLLQLWTADDYKKETISSSSCILLGMVNSASSQTYNCTPPVMIRDSFTAIKITHTQHASEDVSTNFISTSTAGYVSYKGDPSDHSGHYMKTWIPTIFVDSNTFGVSFEVVYDSPRTTGECLECRCPRDDSWSPDVSNLMINH
jgi:hypothetical protein